MDQLHFDVTDLRAGESRALHEAERELAIVAVAGAGVVSVDGEEVELARGDVFAERGSLLYLPPGTPATLTARADWSVAVGSAPADGRHPIRLITPDEVAVEMRGGGAAVRQVNHLLAHPLPAERLIVYEVLVPAGGLGRLAAPLPRRHARLAVPRGDLLLPLRPPRRLRLPPQLRRSGATTRRSPSATARAWRCPAAFTSPPPRQATTCGS